MDLPTRINSVKTAQIYIPPEAENRISTYKKYDYIQSARHDLAFQLREEYSNVVYLAINFPNFVSKEIADMLFGEAPSISVFTGGDNKKVQGFLDDVISENDFTKLLWESAYDNSALGDNIISVKRNDDGKIEIVPLDVMSWSPVVSRLEGRKIMAHEFYYNFVIPDGDRTRVLVWKKTYGEGLIRNEAFEYIDGKGLVPVSLGEIDPSLAGREEEVIDDVDMNGKSFLLPTHVPNFSTPRSIFGVSDYRDLLDIAYEINNRISQIGNILDIHSAPDTVLPEGALDEVGELRKKTESKNRGMMFEVPTVGAGIDIAKKITWDGKLTDGFEEIKMLVEFLASIGETDKDTLAGAKVGIESGRALQMKLRKLIAKAKRREVVYEKAIQEILAKACWLNGFKQVFPREIKVDINLNIPTDEREEAELVAEWFNNGLMSKDEAVSSRMKGKPDEQIKEEIRKIDTDKREEVSNNPFVKPFTNE